MKGVGATRRRVSASPPLESPSLLSATHTCTVGQAQGSSLGRDVEKPRLVPSTSECPEVRTGDGPLGTGVKNREVQSWKLPGGGSGRRGKGGSRGGPRLPGDSS